MDVFPWRFAVLNDTAARPLRPLWTTLIDAALNSSGSNNSNASVVVLCFERPLHVLDDRCVTLLLDGVDAQTTLAQADKLVRREAKQPKTTLFVDSMFVLLLRETPASVWRCLRAWLMLYARVVVLHHADLCAMDQSAALASLADTVVSTAHDDEDDAVLPVPLMSDGDSVVAEVVHRPHGGRLQRQRLRIMYDAQRRMCAHTILAVSDATSLSRPTAAVVSAKPNPAADLTFNLTLSESQRQARAEVVLPYLKAQQPAAPQTGSIAYQYDTDDDVDEDDPDDDLDV